MLKRAVLAALLIGTLPCFADKSPGQEALDAGHYEEAISELTRAYQQDPQPATLYSLAQAQRLAGHVADAIRSYRLYLQKRPDAPNRAEIEGYLRQLELEGDDPDTEAARQHYRAGARAYADARYLEAISEFAQARALKPAPGLDYNIARALDRLEHFADALVEYRRYLASDPSDAATVRARVAVLEQRLARAPAPTPVLQPPPLQPSEPTPPPPPRRRRWVAPVAVVVSLAAVGLAVGLGVGLTSGASDPSPSLGAVRWKP